MENNANTQAVYQPHESLNSDIDNEILKLFQNNDRLMLSDIINYIKTKHPYEPLDYHMVATIQYAIENAMTVCELCHNPYVVIPELVIRAPDSLFVTDTIYKRQRTYKPEIEIKLEAAENG